MVAVLFGLKDWFRFILNSFAEHGVKATFLLIVLSVLVIAPSFVKDYAPKYYGFSIWALILFVGGFLAYRHLIKGTHDQES